jgi:bifunctional non-homologous end joining protein LigD
MRSRLASRTSRTRSTRGAARLARIPQSAVRSLKARKKPTPLRARPRAQGPRPLGSLIPARVAGVELTHPDKILYPDPGIRKQTLALFYESIADAILPHLEGRLLTLVRCPEGAGRPCFFVKHPPASRAAHIRTVRIREKAKLDSAFFIDSLPGLISLVQMDALEIHTWNSRVEELESPDRVVFDFDPAPDVEWESVVKAARTVRDRLELYGLQSFVKTTGGKGLHVVAPITPSAGWDECLAFSRGIAEILVRSEPDAYVSRVSKRERRGKILIDYQRNGRGNTSVSAYSARARSGAPVSTPLSWAELSQPSLTERFTVQTLPARLAALNTNPWHGYGEIKQRLTPALVKEVE